MQECLFGAALVKLLNHRDENAGNKQLIKSIVDKVMRSIMGKADSYKAIVGRAREDSAGSRVAAAVMPMRSQKQRRAAKASSEVRTNTVHAAAALQGRASLGYTGKERLRARLPQELHLHYDRSIHIESAKPKMRWRRWLMSTEELAVIHAEGEKAWELHKKFEEITIGKLDVLVRAARFSS